MQPPMRPSADHRWRRAEIERQLLICVNDAPVAVATIINCRPPRLSGSAILVSHLGQLLGGADTHRKNITESRFNAVCDSELAEMERRRRRYLGSRERVDVARHTAIVIDDGVAAGATTRAGLRAIRICTPKRLVLAVPVAPTETAAALRADVDDLVCLETHEDFGAIGFYYFDFRQVSDEEVIRLLEQLPACKHEQAHQPAT